MNLRNKKFATVAEYDNYIEGNYPKPNVSYIVDGGIVKYQKDAPDPAKQYLTFVALEDGTFQLSGNSVDYSLDGGSTWTTLAANTNTPTVTSGSTIMWKGELIPNSTNGIGTFTSTGNFKAKGNPMSLLFGDNFIGQTDLTGKNYAFSKLFNNTRVINAQNLILPATTLADSCYYRMFNGCTSLTTAPALPATMLTYQCYGLMFNGCTNLTNTPALPATTLAKYCYQGMFWGCTSLTTAPAILPATTLTEYCYYEMFQDCTSLTTAPELPASVLLSNCYNSMFRGCTNLNYVKMMATSLKNQYVRSCFDGWLLNVATTGTFVKNTNSTISLPTGGNGIPSGWTVIEE